MVYCILSIVAINKTQYSQLQSILEECFGTREPQEVPPTVRAAANYRTLIVLALRAPCFFQEANLLTHKVLPIRQKCTILAFSKKNR